MTSISSDAETVIETDTVCVTLSGHVAQLTLTDSVGPSSVGEGLHRDFPDALYAMRDLPDLRAVVFASAGKVFSAGGDFTYLENIYNDLSYRVQSLEQGCRTLLELNDFPVPVVAAMHGDAMGWGATMVLACDAVVAARQARIADPHVRIGLAAGDGGCVVWPQAAGMLRAKRHLLTGDPLTAEDAFSMGLVTDLVDEPGDVLPAAWVLARRIAELPPLAVRGTKRALNRIMQQRAGEVHEMGTFITGITAGSADMLEAITAFRERRPGHYSGR